VQKMNIYIKLLILNTNDSLFFCVLCHTSDIESWSLLPFKAEDKQYLRNVILQFHRIHWNIFVSALQIVTMKELISLRVK